jgi:heterotetrameric sarcosine oxidase delta subunit
MSFLIHCPNCGERSVYEFRFGGELKERPSPDSSEDRWYQYIYPKRNEAGPQKEWWYHRLGCRQWFLAERDTRNNQVLSSWIPGTS